MDLFLFGRLQIKYANAKDFFEQHQYWDHRACSI
jgi:hypothetical protein